MFSGSPARDAVIEYSTVESEPAHDLHDNQAKKPNVDISNVSPIGTGLSNDQDEKGPNTYVGPPIEGWPTDPQRLRGHSIPLLVGDIFLVLLPIGFIGMCFSVSGLGPVY